MHIFPDDVVSAVLRHMNDDHNTDSVAIVQANGAPEATRTTMIALDGLAGTWLVTEPGGERPLRIEWSQPISERAEIRREIVRLHEDALSR